MSATSGHFVKMSSMVDGTLRLTIDVAKEHATEALTTLGFPVGQAVAVTLLHETAGGSRGKPDPAEGASQPPTSILAERGGKPRASDICDHTEPLSVDGICPVCDAQWPTGTRRRLHRWHELTRAQQAGIRCGEERFAAFLDARGVYRPGMKVNEHDAALFVRAHCDVPSRSQLDTDTAAAKRWDALDAEYRAWAGLEPEQRG